MLTTIPLGIIDSAGGRTYATWSPVNKTTSIKLSNLNLTASGTAFTGGSCIATIGKSSGKWYWEITVNKIRSSSSNIIGIATNYSSSAPTAVLGGYLNSISIRANGGTLNYCFLSTTAAGSLRRLCGGCSPCPGSCNPLCLDSAVDISIGDIIAITLDMDNNLVSFYKNPIIASPVSIGNFSVPITSGTWYPACGNGGTTLATGPDSITANFGQNAWDISTALFRSSLETAGYKIGIYN